MTLNQSLLSFTFCNSINTNNNIWKIKRWIQTWFYRLKKGGLVHKKEKIQPLTNLEIEHVALQNTIDYHKSTISWGINTKWPSNKKRSRDYLRLRALQTVRSIWTTQNHGKEVLVWNVNPGVETPTYGLWLSNCYLQKSHTHTNHTGSVEPSTGQLLKFLPIFRAEIFNKNEDILRACLPNSARPLWNKSKNSNKTKSTKKNVKNAVLFGA